MNAADPGDQRPTPPDSQEPAITPPGAHRSLRVWIIVVAVAVVGTAIDLGSKHLAFDRLADVPVQLERETILAHKAAGIPLNHKRVLVQQADDGTIEGIWEPIVPPHDPTVVVPNVLEFKLVLNAGAVFGLGQGGRWIFIAFTGLAFAFWWWLIARFVRPGDAVTQTAIGLMAAGGLGNLYDRLVYACVRDFLHPLPGVHWPFGWEIAGSREIWPYVSNIADAFLLVGIAWVVFKLLTTKTVEPPNGDAESPAEENVETRPHAANTPA